MQESSYFAALLLGLFGGVHCAGMCGGVVGALCFGLPEQVRGRGARLFPYLLAYNSGRLVSYTVAGALMGGVGLVAAQMAVQHEFRLGLQVVAGLFMVVLGLYLGGWWSGLVQLERIGKPIWSRLEPLGRRLLPVRSLPQAFAFGLVWGWLPCGLVYTALIWAVTAAGPVEGGMLMLSFGIGTLPNLFAMGVFAARLGQFLRRTAVRRAAGAMVIAFGLVSLWRSFL